MGLAPNRRMHGGIIRDLRERAHDLIEKLLT
jgi:hypothetical protein